jgi:histidinol-phosphate aminotransferase
MKRLHLIREEIRRQRAYPADAIPCQIKLDANENPFPLPEDLTGLFFSAVTREVALNRYPEAGSPALRRRFAARFGVAPDQVLLGNGSDELILALLIACGGPGKSVLIPTPTFAMYRICGLNLGCRICEAPLAAGGDLDLPAMLAALERERPVLTFLSYPNNPTGGCFNDDKIAALIEQAPGLVVVDEAYGPFSGRSFLPRLKAYDNLLILRTLSKVGLAAMRIGFLVGPPEIVAEIDKVRLPYNLNSVSQMAAGFYLDHEARFIAQTEEIVRERAGLWDALRKTAGVHPWPTDANFIFFTCDRDINQLYAALVKRGVLVKKFDASGNAPPAIRVTVGRREENEAFLKALRAGVTTLGA